MFFVAGVRLWKFVVVALAGRRGRAGRPGASCTTIRSNRILTFLDPESDPLGAGYHITAVEDRPRLGRPVRQGLPEGTQSHLNFLPEKQTDFIFTMLAEEFGLVGGAACCSPLRR